MIKKFFVFIPVVLLLLLPLGVLAHAELESAVPVPGATLTDRPEEIRLTFSETVGPGSTITVFGQNFREIGGIRAEFDPERPEEMFTAVPRLEPGTYSVNWTVLSVDGHPASGSYTFELLPELDSGYTIGVILGTVGAVVLLALGAWGIKRFFGNKQAK